MAGDKQTAWAVTQLTEMHARLQRLPKKDDFDAATLSRIKAFLGPWPRALEKAGLKEKKENRPTHGSAQPHHPVEANQNEKE